MVQNYSQNEADFMSWNPQLLYTVATQTDSESVCVCVSALRKLQRTVLFFQISVMIALFF